MLASVVEEVEHFPWGVVNNLTKASPHMLQRVDVVLRLFVETDPDWGVTEELSSGGYEAYFHQVRSALPELDKKVIMSVSSQAGTSDAISSCDNDYFGPDARDYDDYDDYDADDADDAFYDYSLESDYDDDYIYGYDDGCLVYS